MLEETGRPNFILPQLTPAQEIIATTPSRFRVCCTGRRWGKSSFAAEEIVMTANFGGKCWWLAPAIKTLDAGLEAVKLLCDSLQSEGVKFRTSNAKVPYFTFPGGGKIEFHTANDPNTLRGPSLDLAVFDEAAYIHPDVWPYVISPMLSDRQGRALFLSTPRGRNWYYNLYKQCRYFVESNGTGPQGWKATENAHNSPDWAAFRFHTLDNSTIPHLAEEVARSERELPDRVFRQEFAAEFIEDASTVFRNIKERATASPEGPVAGHIYVIGVDLAKEQDFTVIIVFDVSTMTQVKIERFRQVDYPTQQRQIAHIYDLYRPLGLWIETNMAGAPIIQQLNEDGVPAQGFYTSSGSKPTLIDAWRLAIETDEVTLLDDYDLIDEHLSYELEISPNGHPRYGAPYGKHDDIVMASAICWYGVVQARGQVPVQMARSSMNIYGNQPRRQYEGYGFHKDKYSDRRR